MPKATKKSKKAITTLNRSAGLDILRADYEAVLESVAALDVVSKAELLVLGLATLNDRKASRDADVRVSAIRVVVAFLPISLEAIAKKLRRFSGKQSYEMHYSLFCYLDWAQRMPNLPTLTRDVLALVERYLMAVTCPTAYAVWMAADLLGDHWDRQEALTVLMRAARSARHPVGREGGILGLDILLNRLPADSPLCAKALHSLRRASLADPKLAVRRQARDAFDLHSGLKAG